MLSGTQPAPTPGQQTLTLPSAGSTPGQAATADAVQGTRGTAPLKTYTIDLSRTPSQTAGSSSVAATGDALEDRAPPAELPPVSGSSPSEEASAGQVNPESTTPAPVSAAAAAASPSTATRPAAKPSTAATGAAAPPARTSAAGTPASSAGVPATVTKSTVTAKPVEVEDGGGAWAIQMGSFSSRATAERMVKQLRDSGQQAFVMPVKSGSKTLYRVRVGPMQDKQAAQQLLGKLKSVAAGARLVPHP